MNDLKNKIYDLRYFIILWLTQSFSALGSSMTNFALIIWSYQQEGSALTTALLSVCSYAPYVIMSIAAGALSDKWNKKLTMLICDSFAALCTVAVLILLLTSKLSVWHLYVINALNGLMNTVQQPASDVAISLLTPQKYYQMASGFRSFSNSLVSILTPAVASAMLAFGNINTVIMFDLFTFAVAFISLLFFVRIPEIEKKPAQGCSTLESAKQGLKYLKYNRGILDLMLFLAAINFIASIYNSALPAMVLSRSSGGAAALGIVNSATGIALLIGSIAATFMPNPKSRVRLICNTLFFAMSTENFLLAFGRDVTLWCIGAVLGWICIPIMNANLDVIMRSRIPVEMQGRVYSIRNTLQFFTIPLGYLLGGVLIDDVFEPFMALQGNDSIFTAVLGSGKGSGAALLFFVIAIFGTVTCIVFRRDKHIWQLE